jgi:branched-chain amino acid transport system permease protein
MSCGVQRECSEILLRLLAIGLSSGAVIALNAIGVTLVYGVVRTINFAYGDIFALTSAIAAWAIILIGVGPESSPLALAGGLLLVLVLAASWAALLNVAVERAAFQPFRGRSRVAPLIATIGLSFMLYQGALGLRYLTNAVIPGEHRSVPGVPELPRLDVPTLLPRYDILSALGLRLEVAYPLRDLLVPLVACALALGVSWFLRATRVGRSLRACSQDPEMAQLCGVNLNGTIRLAFALGGVLAGASALIYVLYYTAPFSQYGAQSGLTAFTAAVLGGIGQPMGAFAAGLLLGILAALSDYFLAAQWTPVVILSMLILLLLLRPLGLLGEERGGDGSAAASFDVIAARPTIGGGARARVFSYALIALGLAYPLLDAAFGWRQQLVVVGVLVFALLALGLNLLLGYAGLLDLGYAACFAVGAYAAGMLTSPGGRIATLFPDSFVAVLAASGLAAGLLGLVSAALTLRLRGEYLAIVTLAFGQIVPRTMQNLNDFTGGARGIAGLPAPQLLGWSLQTPTARYYLALGLLLLTAGASLRLAHSRTGRAWAAMSVDEPVAAACGIDLRHYRVLAFVVSSTIAGFAGALFAASFSYVDPNQSEFRLSALVLAMVVLGGAGSVRGAIIGALLVASYDQLLIPLAGGWVDAWISAGGSGWWQLLDLRSYNFLAFGLALYLTTLVRARS